MQTQLFFAVLRGASLADRNRFGIIFHVVADADTETYYFRIISAMNSDKRYVFLLSFSQVLPSLSL